jgi:hypothetical protein
MKASSKSWPVASCFRFVCTHCIFAWSNTKQPLYDLWLFFYFILAAELVMTDQEMQVSERAVGLGLLIDA